MTERNQSQPVTRPDGRVVISDLYGSAFLLAAGHRVLGVEPSGIRRISFVFEGGEGLDGSYLKFLNNAPIGAQDFVSAVYVLKRLLHDAENR